MKYIEKYLDYLKVVKKKSDHTISSYRNDLMELYDFNTDLLNIGESDVSNYLEYLYSKGLNRSSISRKISAIKCFYQYLQSEGLIKINYFYVLTKRHL